MGRRFLTVSGWVLAGGESRRMGRRKELLELGGQTMLERQLALLRAVSRPVAVLGTPESLPASGVPVIADERPGLGPLGGIATALGVTRTEYNLVLGCDLPLMRTEFLRFLVRRALASRADVTVPESPREGFHPTCAVYRRRALPVIRASLAAGNYAVRSFFPHVKVRLVGWPEIARAGFGAAIFSNMNTPEDYRSAQIHLDSQKQ